MWSSARRERPRLTLGAATDRLAVVWGDLERPPLRPRALAAALARDGLWRDVRVVRETASTNADVLAAAREGAPEGLVVVAESQSAGRGRQGRGWVSPPGAGLTFSVLLRPSRPPAQWGWLPLLGGVAVAAALQEHTGLRAEVKWPNDVLVVPGENKVAGVLAEAAGGAVALGVGLNVTTRAEELPRPDATSLLLAGSPVTDRETVLKAVLRTLARGYAGWLSDPQALATAYRAVSLTLGRRVRLTLPADRSVTGLAQDVDTHGRLVVDGVAYSAADVTHLR